MAFSYECAMVLMTECFFLLFHMKIRCVIQWYWLKNLKNCIHIDRINKPEWILLQKRLVALLGHSKLMKVQPVELLVTSLDEAGFSANSISFQPIVSLLDLKVSSTNTLQFQRYFHLLFNASKTDHRDQNILLIYSEAILILALFHVKSCEWLKAAKWDWSEVGSWKFNNIFQAIYFTNIDGLTHIFKNKGNTYQEKLTFSNKKKRSLINSLSKELKLLNLELCRANVQSSATSLSFITIKKKYINPLYSTISLNHLFQFYHSVKNFFAPRGLLSLFRSLRAPLLLNFV